MLSFNRLSASEDFRIHDSSNTVIEAVFSLKDGDKLSPPSVVRENRKPIVNNCEQYRHIVEQYDWDVDTMLLVMSLESSCNPDAVGDTKPIKGVLAPSCGLFQVRTIDPKRGTCEQLKDPSFNVQKAYEIYKSQGLQAWSVTHKW